MGAISPACLLSRPPFFFTPLFLLICIIFYTLGVGGKPDTYGEFHVGVQDTVFLAPLRQ